MVSLKNYIVVMRIIHMWSNHIYYIIHSITAMSYDECISLILSIYEGDPRSNANSCVISFTIIIFQDSLHQNYGALSNFQDPITIFTESHNNPCCLATRECNVNDLGHG